MTDKIERRVKELEALCEAMSTLLLSHIAASDIRDEGAADETLEFAKKQSKAAKLAGNTQATFYLDRFIQQLGCL